MNPFEASLEIKGREEELSFFRRLIATGRMSHGWIIMGPQGSGKMTFSLSVARMLLKGEADNPDNCRHITQNTHGDLLIIEPPYDEKKKRFKKDIPVDSIRVINSFLRRTTSQGGWRVVIIDHADSMNVNASNALLKILEEPPPKTAFFLTASASARLLPTLRSRCRTFQLPPLSDGIMGELVGLLPSDERKLLENKEDFSKLVRESKGRPGVFAQLVENKDSGVQQLVAQSLARPTWAQRMEIVNGVVGKEDNFSAYFLSLLNALSDEGIQSVSGGDNKGSKMASAWVQILKIYNDTNLYNLDKQQALIEALTIVSAI